MRKRSMEGPAKKRLSATPAHVHVGEHLNRLLAIALLCEVSSAEKDTAKAAAELRGAIAEVVATRELVPLDPAVL